MCVECINYLSFLIIFLMVMALKRINGELKDLQKEPLGDLCSFLGPDMSAEDPFKWYAIVTGP